MSARVNIKSLAEIEAKEKLAEEKHKKWQTELREKRLAQGLRSDGKPRKRSLKRWA